MNYNDVFYTILHDTNFFNSFFYEQYVLDLQMGTVYDLQKQRQSSLSAFVVKHNIKITNDAYIPYSIHTNYIILTVENHSQYRIVLKINTALSHFKNSTSLFLSNSHIPIHPFTDLSIFLKAPNEHSSYILYFDFLTNQNLETPENKDYIFQKIYEVFQKEICYFQQTEYHHYYLLIKDMNDIQIINHCKTIKQYFQNNNKTFVSPRFLLVECHNFYHFDNILYKTKRYFKTLTFDSPTFIVKEKLNAI